MDLRPGAPELACTHAGVRALRSATSGRELGWECDTCGEVWATGPQAAAQLHVLPARIRDWRRRGLITPVDPFHGAVRAGRARPRLYRMAEVWDAERATRRATRGAPRGRRGSSRHAGHPAVT